jgi:hypothetical protein
MWMDMLWNDPLDFNEKPDRLASWDDSARLLTYQVLP